MKSIALLKKSLLAASIAAGIATLTACSGGTSDTATTGNTSNATTSGVITGFGSVFVNGVEYETDSA
ncbi:hypothetical protein MNBD_GAMMA10-319, partial [hydrothermal vent metagenome]